MKLTTARIEKGTDSTLGRIYINGRFYSYNLEDTDRGLTSAMPLAEILSIKQYGRTAIPYGIYRVLLTKSTKFNAIWPELTGVPGYGGIRPHAGNTIADTLGCQLPGVRPDQDKNGYWRVWDSQKTFKPLKAKIEQAIKRGEPVTWEIKPAYET